MIQRVYSTIQQASVNGLSPQHRAYAIAWGVYIAFCPFIGFHTLMTFGIGWLFALNVPLMFVVSHIINNPWTMIPVYASGYICGEWILHDMLHIDTMVYNPAWVTHFNDIVSYYTGFGHISFLSFMVGGNLLGIIGGLLAYCVAKIVLMYPRYAS
jgi:uncharacterized protein (DUF2062 family)